MATSRDQTLIPTNAVRLAALGILSESDKRKIYFGNALKLMRMPQAKG